MRFFRGLPRVLTIAALAALALPAVADESDPGITLPPGIKLEFFGSYRTGPDGAQIIEGPLTLSGPGSLIQADRMTLRDGRLLEATGNVLIQWGENRVFGERIEYDLERETGTIHEAAGSVLDEYLIRAEEVRKIGARKLRIRNARVTTCSQPLPYWSFQVTSATITIDRYARMRNVRLKVRKAPVVYLPYLVWPVKDGRAAGLLMPEYSSTDTRGEVLTQELFVPLGRSADLTLLGRYYTEAGFGGGAEFRFIPNDEGHGTLRGFYIDDDVFAATNNGDGRRYHFSFQQEQSFRNGFRLVADMNFISDARYYSDYVRDLNLASSPDTKARLEMSRNGKWSSLNVREFRREQLGNGLVQTMLPEIEWRGRSTKLGPTPFYLAFQSSLANIRQDGENIDANYWRGDVSPTLTLPISPAPWIDITPRVNYRWTRWTSQQRLAPDGTRTVLPRDLSRGLWSYGVDVVGPKTYRIFSPGRSGGTAYKHAIETRMTYGFAESFDRADDVLRYDEIDTVSGSDRLVSYSLVQRLFARKARASPESESGEAEPQDPPEPEDPAPKEEPVEIASLTLEQVRSLDNDLSILDVDGDGTNERSRGGPVRLTGRFNPSPRTSVNLSGTWDVLADRFSGITLSSGWGGPRRSLRVSLVHSEGLGFDTDGNRLRDDTQVRFYAGLSTLRDRTLGTDKLQLSVSGSYLARPGEGRSHIPDQRWTLRYGTQCCTFFVERLIRDIDDRSEYHLRIDLAGVGKILSSKF